MSAVVLESALRVLIRHRNDRGQRAETRRLIHVDCALLRKARAA